eukprot:Hpha_TRINITY_DN35021_c0_g1::TRINITY_DN35021_c0_g1_i1::g.82786::m.82786
MLVEELLGQITRGGKDTDVEAANLASGVLRFLSTLPETLLPRSALGAGAEAVFSMLCGKAECSGSGAAAAAVAECAAKLDAASVARIAGLGSKWRSIELRGRLLVRGADCADVGVLAELSSIARGSRDSRRGGRLQRGCGAQ